MQRATFLKWSTTAVGYFLAATTIQFLFNVKLAELWHTDDGSHYISGAMIAGWISSHFPNPLSYAIDYNAHYPLVGIGLWGPAFYAIEGIWIAVFGGSKTAIFALTASVSAGIATVVAWQCRPYCGLFTAVAAGLLLLGLPSMVEATIAVGLDGPVALAMLLSAIAFAQHLRTGKIGPLIVFCALAIFAFYIKGNSLALYIFVPLAVMFNKSIKTVRDYRFWLVVVGVTAVSAPWYAVTFGFSSAGFREAWGLDFFIRALPQNLRLIYLNCGLPIVFLAAVGCGWAFNDKKTVGPRVIVALALAVLVFQSIVPAAIVSRYLLTMVPCVVILAAYGTTTLTTVLLRTFVAKSAMINVVILVLLFAPLTLLHYPNRKVYHGVIGAATLLSRILPASNQSILVAGFDVVETSFISEMAMLDQIQPTMWIVRGSRLLGGGGYNNFDYVPLFSSIMEVGLEIERYNFSAILLSNSGRAQEWKHIAQVEEYLASSMSAWRLVWSSDGVEDVRVYTRQSNDIPILMQNDIKKLSLPRRAKLQ